MALNSSGPISLGGSVVGQSTNLELGQSATSLIAFNDTNVRNLTGTLANTTLSLPTNFWGKSSVPLISTYFAAANGGQYTILYWPVITASRTDSSLNTYLFGYVGPAVTGNNYIAVWVAKINSAGTVLWQRKYASSSTDAYVYSFGNIASSIATDTAGNLYIPMYTPSQGSPGILKLDSSGNLMWQNVLGNLGASVTANTCGVALDSGGNLISVYYISAGTGLAIVKIDPTGTVLWQKKYSGTTSGVIPNTFVLDSSNNIYVAGTGTSSTLNVSKYDSSGNFVWMNNITQASGSQSASGLVINSSGQLIVSGASATGTFSSGTTNSVLWKINSSTGAIIENYATLVQVTQGSTSYGRCVGLTIDAYDNVYTLNSPDTNSFKWTLTKFSSTLASGPVWSTTSFLPGPNQYYQGFAFNGSINCANNNLYLTTGGGYGATSAGYACVVLPTSGYLSGNRYIGDASPDSFSYIPNTPWTWPQSTLTFASTPQTVATISSSYTWTTPAAPLSASTTSFTPIVKAQTYTPYSASLTTATTTGLPGDVDVTKLACTENPSGVIGHTEALFFTVAPTTGAVYVSQNFGAGYVTSYTAPAGTTVYDVTARAVYWPTGHTAIALRVGTTAPYGPSFVYTNDSGSTWTVYTVTDPTGNQLSKAGAICFNPINDSYDGAGVEIMAAVGSNAYGGGPQVYVMRSSSTSISFTNVGSLPSSTALTSSDQLSLACYGGTASSAACWMLRDKYYGISKSTDHGATWTRVLSTSPTSYGFTSLCQYNGTWVVTLQSLSSDASTMGYYYSNDLGATWTFVQYPNAMASPPSGSGVTYDTAHANFVTDYGTGLANLVIHVTATGAGSTNASAVFISTDKGLSIANTMPVGGSGVTATPAAAVASYGPAIGPSTTTAIRPVNPTFNYTTYNVGAAKYSRAMALDSSNNAYVGSASGTLTKFNSAGTPLLGVTLARSGQPLDISAVKVDSSGNIYLGGAYNAGPYVSPSVHKLDSSGNILWQKVLNLTILSASSAFTSVNLDSSGNVYFAAACNVSGTAYTYVIKFNSSGTILWQKRISAGATLDYGTMDSSNNLYLCGYDTGAIGVLMKIDSGGNIVWQRKVTYPTYTACLYGIAINVNGDVIVLGQSTGHSDKILMLRYNSSGALQIQRYFTAYTNSTIVPLNYGTLTPRIQLAADTAGNVFVPFFSSTTGIHYIANITPGLYSNFSSAGLGPVTSIATVSNDNIALAINPLGNLYCCTSNISTGATYYDMFAVMSPAGWPRGVYNTNGITFQYASNPVADTASSMTDAAAAYTIAANSDTVLTAATTVSSSLPTVVTISA